MCSRRCHGFTLIEMIIAIVIIGVGLAGVLAAFTTTVKASADPLIHKQMLSIAEEMMEEVLLKPFAAGPGAITGCNRSQADDVSDYATYTNQSVCDIDGTAVAGLAPYKVSVAVDSAASLATLASNVKKITVSVIHGTETIILVGWRTNYGS